MSGRGRSKKQDEGSNETESLTKEEDALAKFLRFNCPTKVGNCNGNDFHYFIGSKAVETLLESKKYGAEAKDPKFKTKGDCEVFIRSLIDKGAIFRAKKVVLKKKTPDEKRKGKGKISATSSPRTKREKELLKEEEEKREESDSGTDAKGKDKDEEAEEKKEKKKKVILVMQQNQSFSSDTSDVYAWVFDPTPLYKKVIGALMMVAVVVGCLFPLWPDWLRLGVYYLSMSGIIFLVSIMGLAVARTILFGIIYAATLGKHHLWVLPNLTADCGFFESFQPFYTYEYVAPGSNIEDNKKDKKKSSAKNSSSSTKEDEEEEAKEESKPSSKSSEKASEASKSPSSNEEEEEDEEEEVDRGSESSGGVSSHQKDEEDPQQNQAFETVPAEDFTPEPSNRRRRRARREDAGDFVMVNK